GKPLVPRAAVFAPCEITPGGRGWLAREDGERPVATVLEPGPLDAIRAAYPLDRHLRPALYLRDLLPAYRRLATASVADGDGAAEPGAEAVGAGRETPAGRPQGVEAGRRAGAGAGAAAAALAVSRSTGAEPPAGDGGVQRAARSGPALVPGEAA